MANLVAGRRVVPELIQDDFTPEAVAEHALALLRDPGAARARCARICARSSARSARRAPARGPRRSCSTSVDGGHARGSDPGVIRSTSTHEQRRYATRREQPSTRLRCATLRSMRSFLRVSCCSAWSLLAPSLHATVLVPAEFREVVAGSELIAYGRVVDVRPEWADGRRRIDSVVTVDVLSWFKGGIGRHAVVRRPGRRDRPLSQVMVGAPVVQPRRRSGPVPQDAGRRRCRTSSA